MIAYSVTTHKRGSKHVFNLSLKSVPWVNFGEQVTVQTMSWFISYNPKLSRKCLDYIIQKCSRL